MTKTFQRKSFVILLLSFSLAACGKHKKDESSEVTEGPLTKPTIQQEQASTAEEKIPAQEEKPAPVKTIEPAPKSPIRPLNSFESGNTALNYKEVTDPVNPEFPPTGPLPEPRKEPTWIPPTTTNGPSPSEQDDRPPPSTVSNPFYKNETMMNVFSDVGRDDLANVVNTKKIEREYIQEIKSEFFAALENPDESDYSLDSRLQDSLKLYATFPIYADILDQRISSQGFVPSTLTEQEKKIFIPLFYNTYLSNIVKGYPSLDSGIGSYDIDKKTIMYLGRIVLPVNDEGKQIAALSEDNAKTLDQIALLWETYLQSPLAKPSDQFYINSYTEENVSGWSDATTMSYNYMQEKSPSFAGSQVTYQNFSKKFVDDENNLPNGRIEFAIVSEPKDSKVTESLAGFAKNTGSMLKDAFNSLTEPKEKKPNTKTDENDDEEKEKEEDMDMQLPKNELHDNPILENTFKRYESTGVNEEFKADDWIALLSKENLDEDEQDKIAKTYFDILQDKSPEMLSQFTMHDRMVSAFNLYATNDFMRKKIEESVSSKEIKSASEEEKKIMYPLIFAQELQSKSNSNLPISLKGNSSVHVYESVNSSNNENQRIISLTRTYPEATSLSESNKQDLTQALMIWQAVQASNLDFKNIFPKVVFFSSPEDSEENAQKIQTEADNVTSALYSYAETSVGNEVNIMTPNPKYPLKGFGLKSRRIEFVLVFKEAPPKQTPEKTDEQK